MTIPAMLGVHKRPQGTFDADLEFKDAGLVAASAAATVDSTAKVVDVGTGLFKGCMIIDVTALDIDGNNEIYDIIVQGSPVAAFTAATSAELAAISLSAKEVKRSDCDKDDAVGRYKVYFDNENNGTEYRYLRIYTVCAGAGISTGINYSAYAVQM